MIANNVNRKEMPVHLSDLKQKLVLDACGMISPTWPLDEFIAVNPWWEMRHLHIKDVAAKVSVLRQANCLMPKSYFQELWMETIFPEHLERAVAEVDKHFSVPELQRYLIEDDERSHWHNISDFVDSGRDRKHKMAWRDEITHQISQFCADFFRFKPNGQSYGKLYKGLYREWLETTRQDMGIEILMAEDGLTQQFHNLPDNFEELIDITLNELFVPDNVITDYLHAILMDVNGWASWIAYLRWQDNLYGYENNLMQEFLAIRLAWELVIWRHLSTKDSGVFGELKVMWLHQMNMLPEMIQMHKDAQEKLWIWQLAYELSYRDKIEKELMRVTHSESVTKVPVLQAAFCIDTRSEIFRRALERQDEGIQTLGVGGFFVLPIEYQPAGLSIKRPQLPALLKPEYKVKPIVSEQLKQSSVMKFAKKARWLYWGNAAPATFSMVESAGMIYTIKMIRNVFSPKQCDNPINQLPTSEKFEITVEGKPASLEQKVELVKGSLITMGLTDNFANTVLLVGHGSSSCNNPHAASLDCGACGGQSGEINVKVLAFLLNDSEVRKGLSERGIDIPNSTRFIAAMHNTTTDEVTLFDDVNDKVVEWLESASSLTRQERAIRLGVPHLQPDELLIHVKERSKDWSQVRPEWGLSNNAVMVVAPRKRTRGLDFGGRSFLHEYDWRKDENLLTLTQIMMAPMLVANWINLQYYASVCDNFVYGSGNKVLHNVVDGSVGVFEGNGGDLRIGLPMQSLHNGSVWMHEPLRLSVYVAAPKEAIEKVIAENSVLYQLIKNEWLYCFAWLENSSVEKIVVQ